jgi:hypothetical protein
LLNFLFELPGRALKGHDEVKSGGWRNSAKGSGAAASSKTTRTSGSGGSWGRSGADMLEGEPRTDKMISLQGSKLELLSRLGNCWREFCKHFCKCKTLLRSVLGNPLLFLVVVSGP